MADESERTHSVVISGYPRSVGQEHSTKRRPISAGSRVSRKSAHKASDDHVLNSHDINAVSFRLDRGPWAVLVERRIAIVRPQQPVGEDGVVRIPHVVGTKLETYRNNEEWVIVIETCHQCESHRQEWLRHDPEEYLKAIEVVRSACQKLNLAEPLPMNTPDLGQRKGALEVFLLPPKISQSVYVGYLLHSKLLTRKWPREHSLLRRMQVDMLELDSHGWKSALHGFKGDIFNLFEEAQEEIKRHEEKASIAEKRIVDLEHEVRGLQQRLEQLTTDLETSKSENQSMKEAQEEIKRQEEKASIAEKRIVDLEHEVSEVPGLQQRVEQLEIQNLELTTNLETSNGWLKFSFSENQQMKELSLTKESEAQASLAALEEKLRVKEDTIKDLEGSLVALQTTESKNQELEQELESIRVQRQEDCHYIRSQEDDKRSLTAERDDQRAETSHLKQELDDMKKKLEEIQQDVKAKEQRLHQILELEQKVPQLEKDKLELTESLQVCQKQKFVAETEQKSMNRILLSNSLREKELEKELWLLEEMRTSSEGQLRVQLQELEQQLKERDATIRDLATSQAQLSHTAGWASQALQNESERFSMERRERHHVETEKQSLEDEKNMEMDEKPSGIEAESHSLKVQAIPDDRCEMQDGPAREVPSINDATRQEDEQRSNEDLKDLQSQDLEDGEMQDGPNAMGVPISLIGLAKRIELELDSALGGICRRTETCQCRAESERERTDREQQTDTVAKDEGTHQGQQTEKPEGTDQEQQTDQDHKSSLASRACGVLCCGATF